MTEIRHASWCDNQRTTLDADGLFHECRSMPTRVMDADRQSVRVGLSRRRGEGAAVTLEEFRLTGAQARRIAAALMSAADEAESD